MLQRKTLSNEERGDMLTREELERSPQTSQKDIQANLKLAEELEAKIKKAEEEGKPTFEMKLLLRGLRRAIAIMEQELDEITK